MPTIICPKCKAEYEVPLKVIGKSVRCKQCETAFEAQVLRSQRHQKRKANPVIILVSIMGVVLFIILALIVQSTFKDVSLPEEDEDPRAAAESGIEDSETTRDVEPAGPVRSEREMFCLDFLQAMSDNNVEAIQRMFNFPVYYRVNKGEDDPHWSDLPELDRIMKKKEYTERLTNDGADGGGFVRSAEILFTKELTWDGTEGEVEVGLRHKLNGREQERLFLLMKTGPFMMIYDYEVGEEHGGDLVMGEEPPKTLDQKYKRRISPVGEIREVAFTPDTDEVTAGQIRMLVEDLVGQNRTRSREARTRLLDHGKKAIPGLLNMMAGLDLTLEPDIARANKCVSLLRTLTGRNFHFVPGFASDSEMESMAADLKLAMGRWFGWWERNKDTWTGRDLEKEREEADDW